MIKKAKVNYKLKYPINDIWELITNRQDYKWRYDIASVEKINDSKFIEINNNGLETEYIIEENIENKVYNLKMSNKFINGVFQVELNSIDENNTEITIYHDNEILTMASMVASTLFVSLEKILNRYIYDIESELKKKSVTKK